MTSTRCVHAVSKSVLNQTCLNLYQKCKRSVIIFPKISVAQPMSSLNYLTVRMKTSGWRKKMNMRLQNVCCASSVTGNSLKHVPEKSFANKQLYDMTLPVVSSFSGLCLIALP